MRKLLYISIVFLILLSGCRGCSKSGRKQLLKNKQYAENIKTKNDKIKNHVKKETTTKENKGKNIVKMTKKGGVYYIPIKINGIPLDIIFDTGASSISISSTEAMFLYKQGKLTDEDIKGTQNFITASGDIIEGTIIILRTVKIGNKTIYDVEASVVNTLNAPVLLGQSALEKFGKISIDYENEVLIFED